MTSIDERIVEMRFNNAQFEAGVRTSIKSINDLKKSLELEKSISNLGNLQRAAGRFNLDNISRGIDVISSKFNAMGAIGFTVMQNLTNSAIEMGKRITSALTINPVTDGFSEYETKMNAIQTLLTNTADKGTTLKDVNESLAELNEYADKTIYNFAQMTDNAAKFAAAGLTLNDSVTNVKGLANVAAGFGVSAERMAGATYQMTQAMQNGRVIWQDWNSMSQAGMGGKKLQDAMQETADSLGIARDKSISFKDSLESGWLTAEVFTKTMAKMAKDPALLAAATNVTTFTKLLDTMKEAMGSGWATTWEKILGGKDESTTLFTSLNNAFSSVVGESAKARNEMLEFWRVNGGRAALLKGISNSLIAMSKILEPIEKAFNATFPAITGKNLVEFSKGFRDLTNNFKIGADTINNIRRTFAGLFAAIDIGIKVISAIGYAITSVIKYFLPFGNGFLSTTANIGDFIVKINKSITASNVFKTTIDKIGKTLTPVFDGLKKVVTALVGVFSAMGKVDTSGLTTFSDKMSARLKPLLRMSEVFNKVLEFMKGLFDKLSPSFLEFGQAIGKVFTNLANSIGNVNFDKVFDIINSGILLALLATLKKFMGSFSQISVSIEGVSKSFGKIAGVLDGVRGSLEAYQSSIRANILLKIAVAIGLLTISLMALASIDSKKLTMALTAMTGMFAELFGSMAIFEKVMGVAGFITMAKLTGSMILLSTAILILTYAVKKLSSLDWQGLAKGMVGVMSLSLMIIASAKLLNKSKVSFIKGAAGFIAMGIAINILAMAVEKLGKLNPDALAKGLIGVGILIAQLTLFMKVSNFNGMGISTGIGLIALAAAINILAIAVKKIAELDQTKITKGLITIGVLLLEIGIFSKIVSGANNMITAAISITILGAAMLILSKALASMGSMSLDTIGKGLLTMAGALVAIALAMKLMPANILINSAALIGISVAMTILSNVLKSMGSMSLETIGKGLVTLAGSLTIIAIAMKFMTTAIPGAIALAIIAGALALLTPVLVILGNMSLSAIGTSLLALAGIFAVIGVAGMLLKPLIPVLLSFAATVVLLGVGVLALGAGVSLFAAGVVALVLAGPAAIDVMVKLFKTIITIIPEAAKALGKSMLELVKVIGDGAPVIAKAVKDILIAVLKLLGDVTPVIVNDVLKLLMALLKALNKYAPPLLDEVTKLILALLKSIADNATKFVEAGIDIILNVIKGIESKLESIIQAGIDFIISFLDGLATGIEKNSDRLIEVVGKLINAIVDAAGKAFDKTAGKMIDVGKNIVNGLVDGMKQKISDVANAAMDIGNEILTSAKKVLGIKSPSTLFKAIGDNICQGLTNGIDNSGSKAVTASTNMSKDVVKASNKAAQDAFDATTKWIEKRKYYNQLSLNDELKAWEAIQGKYKTGSEQREKIDREIYRVKQELIKAEEDNQKKLFDKSVDWIEDKKYYNELALKDELAAWLRIQSRYNLGSEQRKQADKEIYRLKKELIQEEENKLKESFDKSMEWIDDKKYYNQLALSDELAAWERVQSRYLVGTEERKKADREVYRLKNELVKEQFDEEMRLLEDHKYYNDVTLSEELSIWEEMQNKFLNNSEGRKQADREVFRLKKEINQADIDYTKQVLDIQKNANDEKIKLEEEYYNKTKEINEKLKQDIKSVSDEYNNAVESRTQSLYSSFGLFDKVTPGESVSGKQLITNLNDQVNQFQSWRDNIKEISSKVPEDLTKELEAMGPKSIEEIKALNSLGSVELTQYVNLWKQKHKDAKVQAIIELEDLRISTVSKIEELRTASAEELTKYETAWLEKMTTLTTNTNTQLELLKKDWLLKVGSLRTGTESEFEKLTVNVKSIMEKPNWTQVGSNLIQGIKRGVQSQAVLLANEVAATALKALNAAKTALGIQSPSKEFAEVGKYCILGMIEGIRNNSSVATQSVKKFGENVLESLKTSIMDMSEITEPIIRPVLDLTNIKNGMKSINGLVAQSTINTSGISSNIPNVNTNQEAQNGSNVQNNSNVNFTQINNSPKELSRLDIYRQTKNQLRMLKGLNPI